jgi:hypothetical protein
MEGIQCELQQMQFTDNVLGAEKGWGGRGAG